MCKILVLAAIVAAVGMGSHAAEARDRTFSFRQFSPHAGAGFHLPHHGLKFHHRSFFGKHRHFKPWRFGHFGHRGFVFKFSNGSFAFKFGHIPHFKPRHFGRFGHKGGFGDHRGFAFRFGHIPHFKPQPFGPGHGGPFFKFGHPLPLAPWHRRGFAFGKSWRSHSGQLMGFEGSLWGSELSPHGPVPGPASFEAVLKQLEDQGFRHVPEAPARTEPLAAWNLKPAEPEWARAESGAGTSAAAPYSTTRAQTSWHRPSQ